MNTFASQVGLAGIIGGCAGSLINGVAGYFSQDTSDEYNRRILVGCLAGAAIAAVGAAIAFANSTGAVMGALAGCIFILANFDNIDTNPQERIFNILQYAIPIIAGFSLLGYMIK